MIPFSPPVRLWRLLALMVVLVGSSLGSAFAQPRAGENCSGGQVYMVDFGQIDSIRAATGRIGREFDSSFKCSPFSLSALTGSNLWITVNSTNGYRLNNASYGSIPYRIYLDSNLSNEIQNGRETEISSSFNFIGSEALSNRKLYIQTQPGGPALTVGRYTDVLSITYRWRICTLGLLICLNWYADKANVTVNLALTIASTCEFRTTQPRIDFGAQPLVSQFGDARADIDFVCTNQSPYNIHIGNGDNPSGTWRRMKGTSGASSNSYIEYQLFESGGNSPINASNRQRGQGTGQMQRLSVTGRVNLNQADVPVGSYIDRPVVIIEY
ncbi:Csu type fimbrial protein [Achromobacter xylosoxidans]|nr:spore coat U domain-containing protein [Achromobacter xylosoxidans]